MEKMIGMRGGYSSLHSIGEKGESSKSVKYGMADEDCQSLPFILSDEEGGFRHETGASSTPPKLSGTVLSLLITNLLTVLLCGALLNYIQNSTQDTTTTDKILETVWCKLIHKFSSDI